MTIGEKIRKMRLMHGYTQTQLGAMVELTGDRIRQYENDVRSPKASELQEIADALDVNICAIDNPELNYPSAAIHSFFEMEELYGLHIEKINKEYHLVFSPLSFPENQELLFEFLDGWYHERLRLQPDLTDLPETITEKKEEYQQWKARFPKTRPQREVDMDDINLNSRIKQLRTDLKMNQKTFAESIGITQSTLSSYENGNASPSHDVLLTISKKYNISLDWLFGISQRKSNKAIRGGSY